MKYQPSLPGHVLFLVLIDLLGLAQLILGPYHHTGLVSLSMIFGLASESTGYVARVLMHFDPFSRIYFLIYLICLTIGPAFIAAAVYLSLGRIVVVYGVDISRIKPRTYTVFCMGCDAISLAFQTIGGGIAASAPLENQRMVICIRIQWVYLLVPIDRSWNTYPDCWSLISGRKFVRLLSL